MTMPNFLIIGAAKAGTTSLYRYLRQHPQIYMSPQKEPRFFALEGQKIDFRGPGDMTRFNFVTDLDSYRALFDGATHQKAIGEVSPWYLYVPQSADRIKHHIPDARLIAILRDPVERAYSNYLHAVQEELEPLDSFVAAMDAEAERIRQNWSYRWHYGEKGYYAPQLQRYFDRFDRNKLRIYLYEDLQKDGPRLMEDMFDFLEVDSVFSPDTSKKFNTAGMPRSKMLGKALTQSNPITPMIGKLIPSGRLKQSIKNQLKQFNMRPKPVLSEEIRARYVKNYREDILRLQDMLDRDLSKWLN